MNIYHALCLWYLFDVKLKPYSLGTIILFDGSQILGYGCRESIHGSILLPCLTNPPFNTCSELGFVSYNLYITCLLQYVVFGLSWRCTYHLSNLTLCWFCFMLVVIMVFLFFSLFSYAVHLIVCVINLPTSSNWFWLATHSICFSVESQLLQCSIVIPICNWPFLLFNAYLLLAF